MLNLHSGGELVEYDALRQLETPAATATHVPIEHFRLVDLVRSTLGMFGHEVVEEHHALDHDGQRYFGLMELRSPYTGFRDTVGLRNSHDKSTVIGVAYGNSVFVCSNLSFWGEHVIRRRHTANAKRALPGLIMEIVEPLAIQRERQAKKFDGYRVSKVTDELADHLALECYRQGVLNIQRIPELLRQWHEPAHDWGEKSMWRFFNAVTYCLDGRVMENPRATSTLHRIIDGQILDCEIIFPEPIEHVG
jgi:hypothetical protein